MRITDLDLEDDVDCNPTYEPTYYKNCMEECRKNGTRYRPIYYAIGNYWRCGHCDNRVEP